MTPIQSTWLSQQGGRPNLGFLQNSLWSWGSWMRKTPITIRNWLYVYTFCVQVCGRSMAEWKLLYTSLASIRHAYATWQILFSPPPKMSQAPATLSFACMHVWCVQNLREEVSTVDEGLKTTTTTSSTMSSNLIVNITIQIWPNNFQPFNCAHWSCKIFKSFRQWCVGHAIHPGVSLPV